MTPRMRRSRVTRRDLLRGIGAAGGAAAAHGLLGGVRPRVSAQESVTLTVWDNYTRPVESQVVDTLNQEFQDSHPGVTINRTTRSFDDLKATARLALSSDDGPDIAQVNQGLSDMGAMVQGGILTDLTPYAQQYGWFETISSGVVARNSFTPDGATFGEGSLFGVPTTAELIGVFYNREKLSALGAELPATFADLEAMLAGFRDAGETPIAFGNSEGWPAIHTYGEVHNLGIDRVFLDAYIYGRPGATFDNPASERAAATLQGWAESGYFTDGFQGIDFDTSLAAFAGGQGATMITGSWISGEIAAQDAANFGFFLTPPETAGATKLSVGGTSTAYAIRNGSPNADLAAEYIDWLLSDRATQLWTEAQVVHIGVDPGAAEPGTLFGDLVGAWARLNETDSVGHYLDWATPTMYDTLVAALQELLGGELDPAGFVQRIQEDYAAYQAERGA